MLSPNLMVPDVDRTVAFYRDVLGFAFVLGVPSVPPDSRDVLLELDPARCLAFAVVKRGNVQIMFQSQQSFCDEMPCLQAQPLGATACLYIELPDARQLYQQVRDRVTVVKDLHRTFYGKEEFYIQDPNGYVLGFAGKPQDKAR
jgi:uncharacterized glyoxalase superfamily protein PhnB